MTTDMNTESTLAQPVKLSWCDREIGIEIKIFNNFANTERQNTHIDHSLSAIAFDGDDMCNDDASRHEGAPEPTSNGDLGDTGSPNQSKRWLVERPLPEQLEHRREKRYTLNGWRTAVSWIRQTCRTTVDWLMALVVVFCVMVTVFAVCVLCLRRGRRRRMRSIRV